MNQREIETVQEMMREFDIDEVVVHSDSCDCHRPHVKAPCWVCRLVEFGVIETEAE